MKKNYKKNKKVLVITMIIIFLIMFSIPTYAVQTQGTTIDEGTTPSTSNPGQVQEHTAGEVIGEGETFIDIGENQGAVIQTDNLQAMSNSLYNILLVVGIIIAVAVGGVLGIKFMLGSIDTQAEVKTMLVPYIAGCIVVFGAFIIWKVVLLIVQG